MNKFYSILTILILIGCQPKTQVDSETDLVHIDKIIKEKTKVFGDSLKIIYEYRGDTVIQKRIDLKGTSDDGFDGSFTVRTILSTKVVSKLHCSKKVKISHDGFVFIFCVDDAIKKIEMDIQGTGDSPWRTENLRNVKNNLISIKNGITDSLKIDSYDLTFGFVRNIKFSIYDIDGKVKIEHVGIEQYETSFSGGRNYYLVNKKKDTIGRFYVNEWMR